MPIKVDIVDSNSSVRVKPGSNSSVKVNPGCDVSLRRLELLIKHLEETKENLGFVVIDEYVSIKTLPEYMLNLLNSYLVNKLSYLDNIYSLAKVDKINGIYEYVADNVSPNTVRVHSDTGKFEIVDNPFNKDHANLHNLDYLHSGHTGFAGIEFGTTEQWNSHPDYRPVEGMLVVYTDYEHNEEGNPVPGIKIGDGNAYLIDKPFLGEALKEAVVEHIENTDIHVTPEEKANWNQKVDNPLTEDDMLILTIDRFINKENN